VYVSPAGDRTLSRDYAEAWRSGQVHRPSTTIRVESYLRLHAYPTLGRRPIGSIRRSETQSWVKTVSPALAPGSVEIVYRWVATIFKAAVGDRLIAASPCIRIALPKRADTEVVPLSVSDVEALAAAVPHRIHALIVLAAGMGVRQGECFGLTVDRVDFLRCAAGVGRQLISVRDGVPEWGPPKSKAGFRTVPIPHVVGSALAEHIARYGTGPGGLIFLNSLASRCPVRRPARYGIERPRPRGCRRGRLPRPPSLLRLTPHRPGLLSRGRPEATRPPVGDGDPRHLQAPVA